MNMNKNRRRKSSLARKRRKLQPQSAGLQLEALEDRHLLTASWAASGTPTSGSETGVGAEPTIVFSPATTAVTTINLAPAAVAAGPGTSPAESSDFTITSITVPAGTSSVGLITAGALTINNDQLVEGNEVLGIQLVSTSVGVTGTQTTSHTILDNETASVEIGNSITEGSGGPTLKLVTTSGDLNKDNDNKPFPAFLEETFSVKLDDTGGTASVGSDADDDVQPIPEQTVFFGAGSGNGTQSGFFTQANSDALVEGTETVTYSLAPSKGYVGVGGNTLNVNDAQSVSVSFVMNPLDPNPMTSVEDANTGDKFVDVVLTMPAGGTLAAPLVIPVTINGTATLSSASVGADYAIDAPAFPITGLGGNVWSQTLTFPAGSGNGTKITYEIDAESGVRDDSILEGNESVTLKLDKGSSIATIGAATYDLTIVDDEAGNIKVERLHETRDESQNVQFKFTVSNTGPFVSGVGPITIPYTLSGSALPQITDPPSLYFKDYNQGATGTITIPFNPSTTSSAILTVDIIDDSITEGDETLTINLANPTNGLSVTGSGATTTIKDNDVSTVNVVPLTSTFGGDIAAKEDECAFGSVNGTAGAKCTSDDARFEVTLSAPSSTDTIVELESDDSVANDATPGSDFSAFPQFVTIPAGKTTSGPITLQIFDDQVVETTENIGIKVKKVTSGDPQIAIGSAASIPIFDTPDHATLTLNASDPIASESTTSGVDNGQFLFQLDRLVNEPITVNYTVSGTAGNGTDYVSIPTTATIPANVFASAINVLVIDDLLNEGVNPETVTLTLTSVSTGGLISTSTTGAGQLNWTPSQTATVSITDNETLFVSVNTTDGNAGESASPANSTALGKGQFTVTLSNPSTNTVQVNAVLTGSASNGVDYTISPFLSNPLVFAPGVTTLGPFDFNIVDDGLIEGTENIILTISDPTGGATLGTKVGTIAIADNDEADATVTAVVNPAAENGGIGQFAFNLASTSTTDTVLNFTLGGTALNNADYKIYTQNPATTTNPALLALSGNAGSVTIPKNTTGPVNLWIVGQNDIFVEGDEGVTITLTGASNSSIAATGSATVTITDDDTALVSIVEVDDKAFEDPSTGNTTAQFQLSVNNPNIVLPMQVQYSLIGGAVQSHNGTLGDVVITGATTTSTTTGYILVNPGVTSISLPITAINDALVEGTEALTMQLTGIVSTTNLTGVGFDPTANNASADICDDDDGAEVFLTFQNLSDTTASEENPADKVPIFLGLTQPSSAPTTIRFSVGGSGIAADAEFNNIPLTSPPVGGNLPIGHDDYMIVGATADSANFPNPVTGRYEYTVVVPAFGTSALVELMALDDDPAGVSGTGVVEGTEFVNIRLAPNAAANYNNSANLSQINPAIVETDKAYITITDHRTGDAKKAPDGVPVVGATLPAVVESGSANAIVTVHSDIEGELDVFYQYVDGTATAATDYNNFGGGVAGSFLFVNTPAGTTNTTVAPGQPLAIDPTNDIIFEQTENFQIQLFATHSNSGLHDQMGFGVGDSSKVEILDDDQISLSVANSVTEKNGTATTTVPVTVSVNPTIPAGQFTIITSDGTAVDFVSGIGSNDYNGTNGVAQWNGSNSFTSNTVGDGNTDATLKFNVVVNGDDVVEGNQKFTIRIKAPAGSGVADAVQEITIVDDDTVKITADNKTAIEGGVSGNLSITTDKAIEGNVTLKLNVNENTAVKEDLATAGIQGDFNPVAEQTVTISGAAGTFTLGANVSTANSNDTVVEGDETATIALTEVKHSNDTASVNPVNGKVTIKDDSEKIKFTIDPDKIELTEGGTASVKVKLIGEGGATSSVPITVNPVTANGSATGGEDFVAIAAGGQPLNFSGSLNQELTAVVTTIDDNIIEVNKESFSLTFPAGDISVNTGASITAPPSVPITVVDNDSATVEIRSETNGAEGGPDGSFIVGFSDGKVTDVDVFVSIGVSGTATAIADYDLSTPPPFLGAPFSTTAPSYIAVIPAGDTGAVVTVDIVNDAVFESTETVVLTEQSVIPAAPRSITSPTAGSAADTGTVNIFENGGGGITPTTRSFSVRGTGWSGNVGNVGVTNGTNVPNSGINTVQVTYSGNIPATAPAILQVNGTTPSPLSFAAPLISYGGGVATYSIGGLANGLPSGKYKLTLNDGGGTTIVNFDLQIADGSGNDTVDFADFAGLATTFGASNTPGLPPLPADFNANGSVDFGDFALLATSFGASVAGYPAPVPPAEDGMAAMAMARQARADAYSNLVDDVFGSSDDDDENQIDYLA